MGPRGLIPSGGGGWLDDALRAAGVLTPRPRIKIPGAAPDAPDIPDVPRLPDPNAPRVDDPDAPRITDGSDAPRDGRFDGEWEDVNTPWYKNPLNLVPAAMAGGIGWLASMMGQDGMTDTSGTADLHEEQAPLPGSKRPMDMKARAAAGNQDAINYLNRQKEGKDRFRQMAMWAGGGQNLGRHNIGAYNMLYDLPPEERQKAIINMMPMDPGRAAIEAHSAKRAGELAQEAIQGMVGKVNNPLAAAAAEAQLPDSERALLHRNEPQIHHSEIKAVDDYVKERHSAPGAWYSLGGLSTSFTVEEQQDTLQWLLDQGYDPAKAQRLVDHIVRVRGTQDWQ